LPVASSAWPDGARELLVKIEVYNESRGAVRLGVAGYVGRYEAVPKIEERPPVFPPGTKGVVFRTVLTPVDHGPAVVHVGATVDSSPLADGWRYIGPVDS